MARIEITITKYEKACPYCKIRPIKKKTCGHFLCQWKHHILDMRTYPRKTERKVPSRQIKID